MKNFWIILTSFCHRRSCLHCGSYEVSMGFLCSVCGPRLDTELWREPVLRPRGLPSLTVRPLFRWEPGRSDLLSNWILAHKGRGHQRQFEWAARQWLLHQAPPLESLAPKERRLILVPAPSSSGGWHALEFAHALADLLGASVIDCLRLVDPLKQRKLGLGERALRTIETIEDLSFEAFRNTKIVLVDDVLTTGLTAEACRRALDQEEMEVWCLAHRSRLAGGAHS